MTSVLLLNTYSRSLLQDKKAVTVLAWLYRLGPSSEAALSEMTQLSSAEVKGVLVHLFKSQMVKNLEKHEWTTTRLGDQVLVRTQIAQVATEDLLDDEWVPAPDRPFLQACAVRKVSYEPSWASLYTRMLHGLKGKQQIPRGEDPRQNKRQVEAVRALLYAVIVGLDPDARQLGAAAFCRHIVRRSSILDKKKVNARQEQDWLRRVEGAFDLAEESNSVLADQQSRPQGDALLLTKLRLVAALLSEQADPGMVAAHRLNPGLASSWAKVLISHGESRESLPWQQLSESVGKKFGGKKEVQQRLVNLLSVPAFEAWLPSYGPTHVVAGHLNLSELVDALKARCESGEHFAIGRQERMRMLKTLGDVVTLINTSC